MSDNTTIARPYAKAIFQHALDNQQLPLWSDRLQDLAQVMLEPAAQRFITNPATTADLQKQFVLSFLRTNKQTTDLSSTENLISLLAANKRLLILPDVWLQYEMLRAEQEKTLVVYVTSFVELHKTQQEQLINRLSHRLQRQVTLEVNIDKSLLGGAVIRAGDLVIDGSVRGKLTKLATELAA